MFKTVRALNDERLPHALALLFVLSEQLLKGLFLLFFFSVSLLYDWKSQVGASLARCAREGRLGTLGLLLGTAATDVGARLISSDPRAFPYGSGLGRRCRRRVVELIALVPVSILPIVDEAVILAPAGGGHLGGRSGYSVLEFGGAF